MVRAYLSKLSSKQRIVFVALDGIEYGPIKSAGSSDPFGFNEGDMPSLSASPGVGLLALAVPPRIYNGMRRRLSDPALPVCNHSAGCAGGSLSDPAHHGTLFASPFARSGV